MLPITSHDPALQEMANVLQDFLVDDVVGIVDSYLRHSEASEALTLGTDGKPVDSEQNRKIIAAMKFALTTATCDRDIIRSIFQNAIDNGYKDFINELINEMRADDIAIVLDNVDFSGLDLTNMNFDKASCSKARFTETDLNGASFVAANLTDAEGLPTATGYININANTVLSGTGCFLNGEAVLKIFGQDSFGLALSNARTPPNHMSVKLPGFTVFVRFS